MTKQDPYVNLRKLAVDLSNGKISLMQLGPDWFGCSCATDPRNFINLKQLSGDTSIDYILGSGDLCLNSSRALIQFGSADYPVEMDKGYNLIAWRFTPSSVASMNVSGGTVEATLDAADKTTMTLKLGGAFDENLNFKVGGHTGKGVLVDAATDETIGNLTFGKPDTRFTGDTGYERLAKVLQDAHDHAARGKGADRHAKDLPFDKQRMQAISHLIDSPDGMAYQVCKKVVEGLGLPTLARQKAELWGAINYLAGIVIFLEDKGETDE